MVLAVFNAAADHADEAHFRIDRELLRREDAALVERLDNVFESPVEGGETAVHRCRNLDAALGLLEVLLEHQTAYTVLAAERLVLASDGEDILAYGPDHNSITVVEDEAPGIAESIATAIEEYSAILLPNRPLAEWEHDGRTYSIGKKLCVEHVRTFSSSMHCSPLPDQIDSDEAALTIDLEWESTDTVMRRIVGLLGTVTGTRRPRRLCFESKEDFERAREALDAILEGLQGNRGAVQAP